MNLERNLSGDPSAEEMTIATQRGARFVPRPMEPQEFTPESARDQADKLTQYFEGLANSTEAGDIRQQYLAARCLLDILLLVVRNPGSPIAISAEKVIQAAEGLHPGISKREKRMGIVGRPDLIG
jgi:hypothetical protein